jgi:hypothetical protein
MIAIIVTFLLFLPFAGMLLIPFFLIICTPLFVVLVYLSRLPVPQWDKYFKWFKNNISKSLFIKLNKPFKQNQKGGHA